jgi:hypothetical protein
VIQHQMIINLKIGNGHNFGPETKEEPLPIWISTPGKPAKISVDRERLDSVLPSTVYINFVYKFPSLSQ